MGAKGAVKGRLGLEREIDRMRHLFTLCSALSLLLFVAASARWVRSYWLSDTIVWRHADGVRSGQTARGSVAVELFSFAGDRQTKPGDGSRIQYQRTEASAPVNSLLDLDAEQGDSVVDWHWHGVDWYEIQNALRGHRYAQFVVPFWCIVAATGLLPLAWTKGRLRSRLRARRERRFGLCPSCGYDIRATPHRCPECGVSLGATSAAGDGAT